MFFRFSSTQNRRFKQQAVAAKNPGGLQQGMLHWVMALYMSPVLPLAFLRDLVWSPFTQSVAGSSTILERVRGSKENHKGHDTTETWHIVNKRGTHALSHLLSTTSFCLSPTCFATRPGVKPRMPGATSPISFDNKSFQRYSSLNCIWRSFCDTPNHPLVKPPL